MAKRKTVRALFDNVHELTHEDIAKSQQLKDLLKMQVPVSVYEAHTANKQYATVFEINATDNYIEIPKKDWIPALETCIMWHLESEDYEKCSKIKEIIAEIQKKPAKKITVKTESDE
jgi:hypothetical protein